MRAGLVAIFFFAALLALGHYVAAPIFCRGAFSVPALDPKLLCGADMHLSRSGSVLLYFGSIAIAFFFGAVAGLWPARPAKPGKADAKTKPTESPEAAVPAQQHAAAVPSAEVAADAAPPAAVSAAEIPALAPSETPAEAAIPVAAAPAEIAEIPAPPAAAVSAADPAPAAEISEIKTPAVENGGEIPSALAAAPETIPEPAAAVAAVPENEPEPAAAVAAMPAEPPTEPATAAPTEAGTAGLAARNGARKGFDGTNQELLERFRELKKHETVNSIAQAQRLLDESMLNALSNGVDPKQHLSEVAHLVLGDDPDLKSGVVRGVVVHIAARLKELGVVQKIPNPAKPAA